MINFSNIFNWFKKIEKEDKDQKVRTILNASGILIEQKFEFGLITYRAYINHPSNDDLQYPNFYADGDSPLEALLNLIKHAHRYNCKIPNVDYNRIFSLPTRRLSEIQKSKDTFMSTADGAIMAGEIINLRNLLCGHKDCKKLPLDILEEENKGK